MSTRSRLGAGRRTVLSSRLINRRAAEWGKTGLASRLQMALRRVRAVLQTPPAGAYRVMLVALRKHLPGPPLLQGRFGHACGCWLEAPDLGNAGLFLAAFVQQQTGYCTIGWLKTTFSPPIHDMKPGPRPPDRSPPRPSPHRLLLPRQHCGTGTVGPGPGRPEIETPGHAGRQGHTSRGGRFL